MAAKRRQTLIGAAVLAVLVWVSAIGSEVDLGKFAANAWRFPKYILETMPVLRWNSLGADLAEWFWGWKGWLKLLWQTVLIAYVGTILGAVDRVVDHRRDPVRTCIGQIQEIAGHVAGIG